MYMFQGASWDTFAACKSMASDCASPIGDCALIVRRQLRPLVAPPGIWVKSDSPVDGSVDIGPMEIPLGTTTNEVRQ